MCIKGNPKSCPQNLSSIDTQTSDTDEKVSKGKEVSGDSSESYIVDSSESYIGEKEEDDDDPFFTCFGEMSDKDFHHMMSVVNDLTYSTLFCDKVFGSAFGSCASLESCNVMGEYARHGEGPLVTSIQSAREKVFLVIMSLHLMKKMKMINCIWVDQCILILAILETLHSIQIQ